MEYNKTLGYCLTRDVKDPAYGTPDAGCMDFFVPMFDERFITDLLRKNPTFESTTKRTEIMNNKRIVLNPGEDACIPSGVHVRLEPHTALTAFNKSGVATKMRLVRGAEYVDCDYAGEVHLHVINVSNQPVVIEQGMKLIQFSYVPVLTAQLKKSATKDELYDGFVSERGEKWQGSTGTK